MFALRWRGLINEFLDHRLIGECPPIIIFGNDMIYKQWHELLNKFGLDQYYGED